MTRGANIQLLLAIIASCTAIGPTPSLAFADEFRAGETVRLGHEQFTIRSVDGSKITLASGNRVRVATAEDITRPIDHIEGFKVGDPVYYGHESFAIDRVYADNTADLSNGMRKRSAIASSQLYHPISQLEGHHVDERVLYGHDTGIIRNIFSDQTALVSFNENQRTTTVSLGDLVVPVPAIDGFKASDPVYYGHEAYAVKEVFPDHTANIANNNHFLRSIPTGQLYFEIKEHGGRHVGESVLYGHETFALRVIYSDETALIGNNAHTTTQALGSLVAPVPASDGFKATDPVYYGHEAYAVKEVFPDHTADITNGNRFQRSVPTSQLYFEIKERGGHHVGETVLLGHDTFTIRTIFSDDTALINGNQRVTTVALASLVVPVPVIDSFKADDSVYYGHEEYKIKEVFPDHTAKIANGAHSYNSIPTSLLYVKITDHGGFHIGQNVLYGHETVAIRQIFSDETVEATSSTRSPRTLGISQLVAPVTTIDGYKATDPVYLWHEAYTIKEVFPDHTVNIVNNQHAHDFTPTSNIYFPIKEQGAFYVGQNVLMPDGRGGFGAEVYVIKEIYSDGVAAIRSNQRSLNYAIASLSPAPTQTVARPSANPAPALPSVRQAVTGAAPVTAAAAAQSTTAATPAAAQVGVPAAAPAAVAAPRLEAKAGEITEIRSSSLVYSKLIAVNFPTVPQGSDPSLAALQKEVSDCGINIGGPRCLDGKFRPLDKDWVAATTDLSKQTYFVKGFEEIETSATYVMVYGSTAENARDGFAFAAIYRAPDPEAGLSHAYGLFSEKGAAAQALFTFVPSAEPGRAALEKLKGSSDPVVAYHAFLAVSSNGDATLKQAAVEYAAPRAAEWKAKAPPAYQGPLQKLF